MTPTAVAEKTTVEPKKMDAVVEALRQLERNGKIDPHDVIDEARDPDSVLHSHFEWDDTKAAEAYRMDQARTLIRSVRFEVIYEDRVFKPVRYVAERSEDVTSYLVLPRIRTLKKSNEVLLHEIRAMHGHAARVAGIAASQQEVLGHALVNKVRGILDSIAALQAELEVE